VQVAKAVEDILYAATQEEGEACLAAAIAELEAGAAAPVDGLQQAEAVEQLQQQLQDGMDLQQQEDLQLEHGVAAEQELGYAAEGVEQQDAAAAVPVC
jgi:hypothetical protein